jgi:hypothetical protein
MAEVFSEFLDTNRIDVTLTSTAVPTMPIRHFERARDLRAEIIDARLWGGLHYRDSSIEGVARTGHNALRPETRPPADRHVGITRQRARLARCRLTAQTRGTDRAKARTSQTSLS